MLNKLTLIGDCARSFWVHTKTWQTDGEVAGVAHSTGVRKRTWEAIRDTQVHTYDIRLNEKYKDAMIAKDELMQSLANGEIQAASEETGGGSGNKVTPVA
jgi:hypothetical protein